MKRIDSRDNPRFKVLRALATDAREQRQSGRTLLDGPHLVAAHRQKVGQPELLLVSESGCDDSEIVELIAAHGGTETLLLRDALFRELSGAATPAGIAAIIAIPAESAGSPDASCVLLDALQDAGNVGSILRSTAAAGIRDVFLGPGCAGAWTPRVLRAAQGAHFDLRLHAHSDLAAILGKFSGLSLAAVAAGGESLYEIAVAGKVAWLFGNEGSGIAANLLGLARRKVAIPMAAGCESLNVAAAAAICLFESVRQGLAVAQPRQ